jgi:hypothetical protein
MIKLKNIISPEKSKSKPKIKEAIHRDDNTAYFSDRYINLQFPRLGHTWTVKTFDKEWVYASDNPDDDSVLEGIEKTMKKCNDDMNKIANKAEREIKSVLKSAERDLTSQEKTWKRKNR